jgi:ABC-type uncharacterized transport system substrate-binding protein
VRRREFIALIGGAAVWPLAARAQQSAKVARIGFLGNSTVALEANLLGPFREGLRELGYQEGRNLAIEFRWAEGKYERFPALIAELIALNVDVIVTAGTPASLAVKKATSSIPLVMVAVGDPVATGLVDNFASVNEKFRDDLLLSQSRSTPVLSKGDRPYLHDSSRPLKYLISVPIFLVE